MPSMAAAEDDDHFSSWDDEEIQRTCQGRIDRLEVENFKSYAGRQQIGPFKQFTAVIGPNGSGKSNLMDAISFVLGVRTQHLRGSLQELLYSNSNLAAAQRPTHGSVTLVYVPEDGHEIHFTRAIQPGAGSSTQHQSVYRIDGKHVTLEAYTSRLAAFGILVKIRNFLVFQGDIEKVAAQTSEGLLQLFEQISGSDALRQPYGDGEKAKDAADKALAALHNKKKAIAAERKTKKEQKEEAERFLAKQEELKEQRLYYYLYRLYVNRCDEVLAEDLLATARSNLQQHEAQHTSYAAELEAVEKQRASVVRQRMNLEKQQRKLEKQQEAKVPGRTRLAEELGRLKKKVSSGTQALEAARKAAEETKKGVKKVLQKLKELQAAKAAADAEVAASAELQMSKEQKDEYDRLKADADMRTSKLSQERDAEQTELKAMQGDLDRQLQLLQEKADRAGQRAAAAAEQRERASALRAEVAAAKKQVQELQKERKQCEMEQRRTTNQREKLQLDLQKLDQDLQVLRGRRAASKREQQLQQNVARLKQEIPGVFGRLSDVVKVTQKQYQLALLIALGHNMDAVVVDRQDTGYKCIDYLSAHELQRMDFIPLDTASVRPIPEKLRRLGGTARLALDLLEYDPQLERAVVHACSDTIVCETSAEAHQLRYDQNLRVKVVARDGTLFKPNGNVTGGRSQDDDSRLGRWDANEAAELEAKSADLGKQLQALPDTDSLRRRCSELSSQLAGLEADVKYKEVDAKQAEEKAAAAAREAASLQGQAQAEDPALQQLRSSVAERCQTVDRLTQRINDTRDRIFADFSRRLGLRSVREYEEGALAQAQQREQQQDQLEDQVNKVTNQLDYEQGQAARKAEAAAAKEQQVSQDQQELQQLEAKQRALKQEEEEHKQQLAQLRADYDGLKKELEEQEGRVRALKEGEASYQRQRGKLASALEAGQGRLEAVRAARAMLLEEAALQQVELPYGDLPYGSDDGAAGKKRRKRGRQQQGAAADDDGGGDADMPDAAAAADARGGGAGEGGDGQGVSSLDFSLLQPRHKQLRSDKDRTALEAELLEALERAQAELARLAPNLKAMEQYAEVRAKEQAQNHEVEAAKSAAAAAAKAFARVKEQRHSRFMRAYQHIKESIDVIYKHLTRSATHPMGGSAYLSLEDETDPFSGGLKYVAMPPTKRFRDMDQLSGGEKTVAALALLFAIHSYRPSPFFVLDEVDAALDAVNVARVAMYIRSKTRPPQQRAAAAAAAAAAGAGSSRGGRGRQQEAAEESQGCQTIVISLKDIFYEKADALVGVCRDLDRHCSTTLTLDLERLPPPSDAL